MASFDCDVLVIGSGFSESVAALRAAEKGYRVGVMDIRGAWGMDATSPWAPGQATTWPAGWASSRSSRPSPA